MIAVWIILPSYKDCFSVVTFYDTQHVSNVVVKSRSCRGCLCVRLIEVVDMGSAETKNAGGVHYFFLSKFNKPGWRVLN